MGVEIIEVTSLLLATPMVIENGSLFEYALLEVGGHAVVGD